MFAQTIIYFQRKKLDIVFLIITCAPSTYTLSHPDLTVTVSNFILVLRYSVDIFSYSRPSRLLGSDGKQNTTLFGSDGKQNTA